MRVRPSSRSSLILLALGLVSLGPAAGCGKGAAEEALAAAAAAFDQAKPELERYVPAELDALTKEVSKARATFDKGDYTAALQAGQALLVKVKGALETARKRKDELVAAFEQRKSSLPELVGALERRLGQLSRSASLPADLDLATVETAQANLETLRKSWTDALKRFDSGDVTAALAQADDVKTQVEELAKAFLPAGK